MISLERDMIPKVFEGARSSLEFLLWDRLTDEFMVTLDQELVDEIKDSIEPKLLGD